MSHDWASRGSYNTSLGNLDIWQRTVSAGQGHDNTFRFCHLYEKGYFTKDHSISVWEVFPVLTYIIKSFADLVCPILVSKPNPIWAFLCYECYKLLLAWFLSYPSLDCKNNPSTMSVFLFAFAFSSRCPKFYFWLDQISKATNVREG